MKIESLQVMRIKNRQWLAACYDDLAAYKQFRKIYDKSCDTESEYYYHNKVNKCKAEIKKLVALQMDIKHSIKREIAWQRQVRKATLMKQSAMANVGECF